MAGSSPIKPSLQPSPSSLPPISPSKIIDPADQEDSPPPRSPPSSGSVVVNKLSPSRVPLPSSPLSSPPVSLSKITDPAGQEEAPRQVLSVLRYQRGSDEPLIDIYLLRPISTMRLSSLTSGAQFTRVTVQSRHLFARSSRCLF